MTEKTEREILRCVADMNDSLIRIVQYIALLEHRIEKVEKQLREKKVRESHDN